VQVRIFTKEGDFVKPFSSLTGSAEFMLVPLIALCCCEHKLVESRAQLITVRVQWNQKVLLIFGKSTIYRKKKGGLLWASHKGELPRTQSLLGKHTVTSATSLISVV